MLSHFLESIEGIGIYQLISLLMFVPFFVGVLIYVTRLKKEDADRMSNIPLN